jgi:hypothetical protein
MRNKSSNGNAIPLTRKKMRDPVECFNRERPPEISEEDWDDAKSYALSNPNPERVPSAVRELAYRRYHQQYSFDEIADHFNLDLGRVIYTAITDDWFNRSKREARVRGSASVERADVGLKELIIDILEATSATYTHQLRKVIQDPSKADECNLIPKTLTDVKVVVSLLQSLQAKEVPVEGSRVVAVPSVTNVNVQNLISGTNRDSTSDTTVNATAVRMERNKELASNSLHHSQLSENEMDDSPEGEDRDLELLLRAKNER